jgi:dienelactone hydrolase
MKRYAANTAMGRLALATVLTATSCYPALKLAPNDADVVLAHHTIQAPDPSLPGSLPVHHLYYGSGIDRNRPVYRDSVTMRTDSVDASKLVDLGQSGKSRNKYWGFTPKGMPLNGRVWYPEGEGPFPLVLVAHGNHDMTDYSDPGYGYLGELLASRGYILVSLDMNFINGGIRNENDGRGWFFLKHLEQWKKWNESEGNPFTGKVDMENIAIIGHSRGGEAVGQAANFNRLSRYPDDANVKFDFNFNIKSIVAIAPVDGQYRPGDRLAPVENVNYLVFHGTHDGDVSAFMGIRQYQRVQFTDGEPHFKAAVLVYRANHGQWNTVWNNHDNGPRSGRILDLRTLMPREDQRQFAKVYISAFLDATLRDDQRYLPLFRDHRVAGDWLPKTMYITRFEESSFKALADYEEDTDVTTGAIPGVRLEGDSLATWKESLLQLRTTNSPSEGTSQYNYATTLGWNNRIAGDDTTRMGPPARYTINLPFGLSREWGLDADASVQFLMMPTDAMPGPRRSPDPPAKDSTSKASSAKKPRPPKPDPDAEKPPVDLSVELTDALGHAARVQLSRYAAIRRPLEAWILRRRDQDRQRFGAHAELVLQTFSIPLGDFKQQNAALDFGQLTSLSLVFDRATAGTIVLDEIGFATMNPAFRRATVTDAAGGGR